MLLNDPYRLYQVEIIFTRFYTQ